MRTFKNCAAQGDLLITRIEELPTNITEVKTDKPEHVVAHSETGHHHVLPTQDVDFFRAANDDGTNNEFVSYLRVKRDTVLRHLRHFDTHEPLEILEGLYKINRQREYTPEGFRRVAD